jgi:zinc transport system substrate-binding protein
VVSKSTLQRIAEPLLVVLTLAFLACSPTESKRHQDKLLVVVSINPLADLVGRVGGERVDVTQLVPPGASPHTYEPTPSQVGRLARARLLVLVGLDFEFWAEDMVDAVGNPRLVVADTSAAIEPIDRNPHTWLDPRNAILQVESIRDSLQQVDPEGRRVYEQNAERLVDELRALDQEIEKEIGSWSFHSFVAFHPAWSYFAKRYGLEQAAVVEETPGHEPSMDEMAHVIETAKAIGARAIFAEPQLPPEVAETIAEETGASVLLLDPIGGAEAPDDYLGLIRYNVQTMAKAMK